jgi:hypothetical protein
VQALVGNTLEEASNKKDDVLIDLYKALDYGETLIQMENNDLDDMAAVREGRQKSVLLEKASNIFPPT